MQKLLGESLLWCENQDTFYLALLSLVIRCMERAKNENDENSARCRIDGDAV